MGTGCGSATMCGRGGSTVPSPGDGEVDGGGISEDSAGEDAGDRAAEATAAGASACGGRVTTKKPPTATTAIATATSTNGNAEAVRRRRRRGPRGVKGAPIMHPSVAHAEGAVRTEAAMMQAPGGTTANEGHR